MDHKKPMLELPGALFEVTQNNAVIFQYLIVLFQSMMQGYKDIDVALYNLLVYCNQSDPPATIVNYLFEEARALRQCIADLPSDELEIRQAVKSYWLIIAAMHGQSPLDALLLDGRKYQGSRASYDRAWRMHRILSHKADPLTAAAKALWRGDYPVLSILDKFNQKPDILKRREMLMNADLLIPGHALAVTHDDFMASIYTQPPFDERLEVR